MEGLDVTRFIIMVWEDPQKGMKSILTKEPGVHINKYNLLEKGK